MVVSHYEELSRQLYNDMKWMKIMTTGILIQTDIVNIIIALIEAHETYSQWDMCMILQAGFIFDIEGGIKEEKGKHVICLKNEKWQKKQCNYYHVYLFE